MIDFSRKVEKFEFSTFREKSFEQNQNGHFSTFREKWQDHRKSALFYFLRKVRWDSLGTKLHGSRPPPKSLQELSKRALGIDFRFIFDRFGIFVGLIF